MKLYRVQVLIWLLCCLFVSTQSRYTQSEGKYVGSITNGDESVSRLTEQEERVTTLKKVGGSVGKVKSNQKSIKDDVAPHYRLIRASQENNKTDNNIVLKGTPKSVTEAESKLPQAMEPFHVVATSAVIKNKGKKPATLTMPKAIHIWGPTPFKTIMEKLANLNNNLRRQQGEVKRLMLPNARLGLIGPLAKQIFQERSQPLIKFRNRLPLPFGKQTVPGGTPRHFVLPQIHPVPPVQTEPETIFVPPPPLHPPPPLTVNELTTHEEPEQFMAPEAVPPQVSSPPELPDYPPEPPPQMFEEPHGADYDVVPAEQEALPQQLPYDEQRFHHHHHHHYFPTAKAHCSPNPCKNAGTCTAVGDHYECTCPLGFMGKICEETNHCLPNPCKNSGNCYPTSGGYTCTCVKGFRGSNCEAISRCVPNPCKNGGVCEELATGDSFSCKCVPGYKGYYCEVSDHCEAFNPCKNGGTCINGEKSYECQCPQDFTGKDCGDMDLCYSRPCLNGGTCMNTGAGQFLCQCISSYRGKTCGERISKCDSQPCDNGGTCVESDDEGFHCICSDKFTGKHCRDRAGVCSSNHCQHGGKCVALPSGISCECLPGYAGTTCEVALEGPVSTGQCGNCPLNAYCLMGNCACKVGFIGDGRSCEARSLCHPNPCYNGGACSEMPNNGFACECTKAFVGPVCKDIRPCLSQPCKNGGTCFDGQDDAHLYTCKCSEGFTGKTCEESSACSSNPCQNGGNCITTHDTYACECSDRFEGPHCEDDKCDICDLKAHCVHGICSCNEGYTGQGTIGQCLPIRGQGKMIYGQKSSSLSLKDVPLALQGNARNDASVSAGPIDPCAGQPCKNGGICGVRGDHFKCICPKEFQGPVCEQHAKSHCHPNPCLHGGLCEELGDSYKCNCIGAYKGINCELDECEECDVHAICEIGACKCRSGYEGDGITCKEIGNCHNCSPQATCVSNECICKPGFTGNGKHCHPDQCSAGCPQNSQCSRGVCVCANGFHFDGHKCAAILPVAPCPATCSTDCDSLCPARCCKITMLPLNCPIECGASCSPSCPVHCCTVTVAPCPPNCALNCGSSCPSHCCKPATPGSVLSACPVTCTSGRCGPSCPMHCCIADNAHASSSCPGSCAANCNPSCPAACCTTHAPYLPPSTHEWCPISCKYTCHSSCPQYCCSRPVSACPSHCSYSCDASCKPECCGASSSPVNSPSAYLPAFSRSKVTKNPSDKHKAIVINHLKEFISSPQGSESEKKVGILRKKKKTSIMYPHGHNAGGQRQSDEGSVLDSSGNEP